jgi:hypothetical protein
VIVVILSAVTCLAGCATFYTLPHKWHDCRKKVIEYKMRVTILSTTCLKHLILTGLQPDSIITVRKSSRKESVILVRF